MMAARNERPYLANCLDHLIEHGARYFIVDNGSDDGTAQLLRQPRYARNLAGLTTYPYAGLFDWDGILRTIDDTTSTLGADWVILSAPDEILHPRTDESLSEAIARLDGEGFDAIDFNEFVFLPIDHDYMVDLTGPQPLQWYYFHEPRPNRLLRARRASLDAKWRPSGGHWLDGGDVRIATERFVLRHYIFRSQEHAYAKYAGRTYRPQELGRGWHGNRFRQPRDSFTFPDRSELEFLSDPAARALSPARPRKQHYWEWPGPR